MRLNACGRGTSGFNNRRYSHTSSNRPPGGVASRCELTVHGATYVLALRRNSGLGPRADICARGLVTAMWSAGPSATWRNDAMVGRLSDL